MDVRNNNAWCGCKLFESHGIMCRHLIRVFACRRIKKVPDMFILDRWRKDIVRKHTKVKVRHHDLSKTEEFKRYDEIMVEVEPLGLLGAKKDEFKEAIIQMIRETIDKLQLSLDEEGRSKEGPDIEVSPPSVNNHAAIHNGERVNSTSPPSIQNKSTLTGPDGSATWPMDSSSTPGQTDTHEPASESGATGGSHCSVAAGGEPLAGQLHKPLPLIIKDPPLPKQPNHRPIESRYKSAAELHRGEKGKGAGKGTGKDKPSESEGSTTIPCASNGGPSTGVLIQQGSSVQLLSPLQQQPGLVDLQSPIIVNQHPHLVGSRTQHPVAEQWPFVQPHPTRNVLHPRQYAAVVRNAVTGNIPNSLVRPLPPPLHGATMPRVPSAPMPSTSIG